VDCEKFDRVVLDLLYEELDELTGAAAKRHMDHCARCRSIGSGLRATREVGILPLLEPPEGLEQRILEAERGARARLPLRQRIGRAVSVAAEYAMRPQLAMAAVLLLMIGASLLFLRVEPGQRDSVRVTERGVAEGEQEGVAIIPLPEKRPAFETMTGEGSPRAQSAPPPAAVPEGEARRERGKAESAADDEAHDQLPDEKLDNAGALAGADLDADAGDVEYDQALQAYNSGRFPEAQRSFDQVASRQGTNAASASLYAAQAVRKDSGCKEAARRFDEINTRYRGSRIGDEAAWQAAECYRALGDFEEARRNYEQLVDSANFKQRAQAALATLGQQPVAARSAAEPAPAKSKATRKPASAAPKQAAPPPARPRAKGESAF
jgi:tetratricopeptide (TPR) repeat protein